MSGKLPASDLHHFMRTRRSVRRFQERAVPQEMLERIIETTTWAASAHNRQPWRFVALQSQDSKRRLAEAMAADFKRDLLADGRSEEEAEAMVSRSRDRLIASPVAVLLCLDFSDMDEYPDETRHQAEHQMAVQSVALAGGNLLLAAHAEGLGAVWTCSPLFAPETVRRTLDLPAHWEPQGLILLGYPDESPEPRPRSPLSEVARFV